MRIIILAGICLSACRPIVHHVPVASGPTFARPVPTVVESAAEAPAPRARETPVVETVAIAEKREIDQALGPTLDSMNKLLDAYFDYNRYNLRPDAVEALAANASMLKTLLEKYPSVRLILEGHCDERGPAEYNLALGEMRAQQAKELLVNMGIPGDRVRTISFGKERPQCLDPSEECWQKNRRAHLARQR